MSYLYCQLYCYCCLFSLFNYSSLPLYNKEIFLFHFSFFNYGLNFLYTVITEWIVIVVNLLFSAHRPLRVSLLVYFSTINQLVPTRNCKCVCVGMLFLVHFRLISHIPTLVLIHIASFIHMSLYWHVCLY